MAYKNMERCPPSVTIKRYISKAADIILHTGGYHGSEQLVLHKVAKLGGNRAFFALLMGRQIGIISSQDNRQYHSKWKHTTSRLCDLTSRTVSVNACRPESTKKATIVECGGFIAHPSKIGCTPQKAVRCLSKRGSFLTSCCGLWALIGWSGYDWVS